MIDLNEYDLVKISKFIGLIEKSPFTWGYFETLGEDTYFLHWLSNPREDHWSFNMHYRDAEGDWNEFHQGNVSRILCLLS